MRALAEETGLMNRTSRRLWKRLGIAGEPSRYRGEPERTAELYVVEPPRRPRRRRLGVTPVGSASDAARGHAVVRR